MWKVTLKGIWAKKVRFLLTGVAVILGVVFISGTFVLTATISKTFDGLFSDIYENTDAVVRVPQAFKGDFGGGRGRISADLLPTVRSADGVAAAAGTVQGIAVIVDKDGDALGSNGQGAPTLGFAWIRNQDLSTLHLVVGKAPTVLDDIVIDKKSADDAGYKPGDTVPVLTKEGRADYDLTGIVKFGSSNSLLGATIVAFPPETASRVLAEPGMVDAIDVKADSGVTQDEVVRNIRAALRADPAAGDIEVISGDAITTESQDDFKDNLSFFNTFLLVFGIVALLVGSFIIFNTFSIIVAQRGAELAPLRAIGAGQRQVLGSVLFEAVLVGITVSTIGFVVGDRARRGAQGVARGTRYRHSRGIDRDSRERDHLVVRDGHGRHDRGGDDTGVQGVEDPADRGDARRVDRPIEYVARFASSPVCWSRSSARVLLALGLFGDSGLAIVGLGMGVVFLGVAILGPVIVSPISGVLGAPIHKLKGITGQIARENAMRNPKRTSATAAALDDRCRPRRAHHDLRGFGVHFGRRGDRPFDEGRLRRELVRVRSRQHPDHARGRAAERPECRDGLGCARRRSEDQGVGRLPVRRRPAGDQFALRPASDAGRDLRPRPHRARGPPVDRRGQQPPAR